MNESIMTNLLRFWIRNDILTLLQFTINPFIALVILRKRHKKGSCKKVRAEFLGYVPCVDPNNPFANNVMPAVRFINDKNVFVQAYLSGVSPDLLVTDSGKIINVAYKLNKQTGKYIVWQDSKLNKKMSRNIFDMLKLALMFLVVWWLLDLVAVVVVTPLFQR